MSLCLQHIQQAQPLGWEHADYKVSIIILYMYVDMSCGHLDISINSNNFMYEFFYTLWPEIIIMLVEIMFTGLLQIEPKNVFC